MTIRHFKIIFVLLLALMCLIYAFQNIANIDACYQAIAYVISMQEHTVYPDPLCQPLRVACWSGAWSFSLLLPKSLPVWCS